MIDYVDNRGNDMATDLTQRKISNLSGKAAVFVRGFIEFCDTFPQVKDAGIPMRKAQEAGMAAVVALEEEISVAYISKLTNVLITTGVLSRERVGKHYMVKGSTNYPWLIGYLQENEWGSSMTQELPLEQIVARSAFLDHMNEHQAVRIKATDPLEKAAYQVAIEKFKSGDYDMVFVEHDEKLSVLPIGWGDEDAIPTFSHASVANR